MCVLRSAELYPCNTPAHGLSYGRDTWVCARADGALLRWQRCVAPRVFCLWRRVFRPKTTTPCRNYVR